MNDDLLDEDVSSEGGADYKLSTEDFRDTFIIPSDWTVSTLRREMEDIVDLSPHFQRRSVWSKKAKSKFIESLILGIPIPQILLAEDREERNKFLVLDGKQRMSAIAEFFSGQFDDGSQFRLQGLDDIEELNGCNWNSVQMLFPDYARALEAAPIRTAIIRGWKKDDVLYEIFFRLNSGSVKLSPMELRMSLIRGPFVREVISQTADVKSIQKLLGLPYADKRMKDVEIAIRYMAFSDGRIPYRGNLKLFLDDYCRLMNQDLGLGQPVMALQKLDEIICVGMNAFPPNCFARKFLVDQGRYERPFNRAVFDVLAGSLNDDRVIEVAAQRPADFEAAFKDVCAIPDFIRFVESTTKSVEATHGRFHIWFSQVHLKFGIMPRLPSFA